jgi:hypothetical protein
MHFFGPANVVTTFDDGTSLFIKFKGQRRWFDLILIVAATGVSLYEIWSGNPWAAFGAVALAGVFLFQFLFPPVSSVYANAEGIEVSTQQRFRSCNTWTGRWSEISGLEYRAGGEDEPSGFMSDVDVTLLYASLTVSAKKKHSR